MAVLRVLLLVFLSAAAAAGCFSPHQPPCAFSCADDGVCPSGYSCQADGVCHRQPDDGQGMCGIPSQIDAADDGSRADGASGDGVDGDGATADGS